MNFKKEREKIADTAAGQKAFIQSEIPKAEVFEPSSEKLKLQIIRISVAAYIDGAEAEKKRLLDIVEVEKSKNRDIKDIAERLAVELDRLSPGHALANDTLALLLENKMKGPTGKKKHGER